MTLRPDETIQKALLSTTSRFTGEYETEAVLLTHAWVDHRGMHPRARMTEGPASRSGFMLTFRTEPYEKLPGTIVRTYSHVGERVAALLSVFFGKRFDSHGVLEHSGMHTIPDISSFNTLCDSLLPHNTYATRVDFAIPLDLSELRRVESLLLYQCEDQKFSDAFAGAANFYHQALQNFERQPEVAYLHLITAGEIISNFGDFKLDELLDDEARTALARIEREMPDGVAISKKLSSRFRSIKKKFVLTLVGLMEEDFFQRTDMQEPYGRLKSESFKASIAAAYDLRSKHLHTGRSFGDWVSVGRSEAMNGRPMVDDKEFGKILHKAPTLMGLERVVRYCLLRFAETNGVPVRSNL